MAPILQQCREIVFTCILFTLAYSMIAETSVAAAQNSANAPQGVEFDATEPETKAITGTTWWPIGPAPIINGQAWPHGKSVNSGRVNAVAVNPFNPDDVWIGSATGGVWRRVIDPEGHNDWEPVSDGEKSLAIGIIRLDDCDATHCETVYAGTGENGIRRDTYYGAGLLRGRELPPVEAGSPEATDKAHDTNFLVWDLLGEAEFTHGSITGLVLDPTTETASKTIYVALSSGVTANATHSTVRAPKPAQGYGIFKSDDAGVNWTRQTLPGTTNNDVATDLEIDPQDPQRLYAGIQGRGIFRTTNGGSSWQAINNGLEGVVATGDFPEIAVFRDNPGQPARLYLMIADCPPPHPSSTGDADCDPQLFVSNDGGDSWNEIAKTCNPCYSGKMRSYTMYTHALTIHPTDPDTLFYGGVLLYRSTDGGVTWSQSGTNVLHPDHHQVTFAESDPSLVYNANDGGVWVSDNGGIGNWNHLNQGLQITQVQSVAISPKTEAVIIGTQDNGTNLFTGTRNWGHIDGGDAASTVMDADDIAKVYDVYVRLIGSPRRCATFGPDKDPMDICSNVWPAIQTGIDEVGDQRRVAWYPPLVQDPNASAGSQHTLYHGTVKLYRSTNDGASWQAVSTDLGTGVLDPQVNSYDSITAIAVAPSDSTRLYIGYHDGGIFRTDSGGAAPEDWIWTDVSGPGNVITSLAVDPENKNHVYVTYSEWGIPHVRFSDNGGGSWTDIHGGLPDIPANVIAVEVGPPKRLWLGTDRGIYQRPADLSEPWQIHGQGAGAQIAFPNVAVYDLEVDEARGRIYAGTHGRGVWVLTAPLVNNFEAWVDGSIWDIPIFGDGFLPADTCTVSVILESGATCWEGTVDQDEGDIHVQDGKLVTSNMDEWNGKQVVWACRSGTCMGGVPITECGVDTDANPNVDLPSSIVVNCKGQQAFHQLTGCPSLKNPPSSPLQIDLEGMVGLREPSTRADKQTAGRLQLFPTLQVGIPTPATGPTRTLCSVEIEVQDGDNDSDLVLRAAAAVEGAADCIDAGVRAFATPPETDEDLEQEDPSARIPQLAFSTPDLTGSYVFPGLRAGPGQLGDSCVTLGSLGVPILGQMAVLEVRFETLPEGALGGEVTLMENTFLGACEVRLETTPGQDATQIASGFEDLFLASGIPGPNPGCKVAQNPRDVSRNGNALVFIAAQDLQICVRDPGVGFFVIPEEIPGTPPVADAGPDQTVQPIVPGPTAAQLNGNGSSDADSTPGTNDDIVAFRWYRVLPDDSRVLIATGSFAQPLLPTGTYDIVLQVEDQAGLTDEDQLTVTVLAPDCNGNGIDDALDLLGLSSDLNGTGVPDECEQGTVYWQIRGAATGGTIGAEIQGFQMTCTVVIATNAGDPASTVAAQLAAAFNADACLAAQGITAQVLGSTIVLQGLDLRYEDITTLLDDPGLIHEAPAVTIPVLSPVGLALLIVVLLSLGFWYLQRARKALVPSSRRARMKRP